VGLSDYDYSLAEPHKEGCISCVPNGVYQLVRQSCFVVYVLVGTAASTHIEEQSDREWLASGGRKRFDLYLHLILKQLEFFGFEIGDRPTVLVEGAIKSSTRSPGAAWS